MSRIVRWFKAARHGGHRLLVNAPLILLSLGLATVLWAFVTNQENPAVNRSLGPAIRLSDVDPAVNVPKNMVVTRYSPDQVSVTLIGSLQDVQNVGLKDIQLQADLSNVGVGAIQNAVTVPAPLKAIVIKHRGVRATVDANSVDVTLEPEERRTVPIKVSLIDAPPVGFELDSPPSSDPDQATVSGLKQNVDTVDAVYADLKLTGLSVTTTLSLPLSPRSSDGRTVSNVTLQPESASVKVTIKRTIFNRDAFVSVHTHGRPALGYQVQDAVSDPPTVTIAGSLDQLNSVTTIATDDVELEGATQDVKRVLNLKPPPGITIVSGRTVTATVTITAARGAGSVLVAPRLVGVTVGQNIQIGQSTLTVSFTGPMPVVLVLKAGDVTASVDVSGLGPGTYSIEPKITLPAGLDKDSVAPARVDITIAGPPATPAPTR